MTTTCKKCHGRDGRTMEAKGQTFVSPYTNGDAVRRLAEAVADGRVKSDFARELVEKWARYNRLSDAQWVWIHKLVHDRLDHPYDPSERAVDLGVDGLAGITGCFATAGKALKHPRLRFELESGVTVVCKVAGARSRYAGDIHVTDDKEYGANAYFGRIGKDGRFYPGRNATDEIVAFLKRFAADPAGMAIEYGKRTGRCCFCGRELKHGELGYGPQCAKNWGLPWTEKLAKDSRVVDPVPVVGMVTPKADPAPKTDPSPTDDAPKADPVTEEHTEGTYTKFKVRVYAAGTMKPLTTMDYYATADAFGKAWAKRTAKYPEAVILSYGLTDEGWVPYWGQNTDAAGVEHKPEPARKSSPKPRRNLIRIEVRRRDVPGGGYVATVVSGQLHEDKNWAAGANRAQALATLGAHLNMEGVKGDVEVVDV